ncbi:MAG: tetratricopeptide repeat protein, partial [Acidobacteria bacterium]|nr:tetratricopeptide repeat protein [Acidobacteriota bacterium]
MQCEEINLIGFVNSELGAVQTSAVLDHLQQCRDCEERLNLLLEMRSNRAELRRLGRMRRRRFYLWPVAAGLLLAALLAAWFARSPRDLTRLAASAPYPMAPPELRSAGSGDRFLSAARAYARNDWAEAEAGLRTFLQERPDDYEAAFYLANVLYAQQRLDESEMLLQDLARRNSRDNRVQWYLASVRLRRSDAGGAIACLE